jgi:hypothetical protein
LRPEGESTFNFIAGTGFANARALMIKDIVPATPLAKTVHHEPEARAGF